MSRSAMMSTTTVPSTSASGSKHSFSHPRFDNDGHNQEYPGSIASVGEMINPSIAIEGGKKFLGQLIGSMTLNVSADETETSSNQVEGEPPVRRPAKPARALSLITGTGVHRVSSADKEPEARIRDRPSMDAVGRRSSNASTSTMRSDSTSRSIREEESLGGLGFGQALEDMVDTGGWTKKWGDVMSNPQ